MKKLFILPVLFFSISVFGQELYVFTEPASNMPAKAIYVRTTGHFSGTSQRYDRFTQRYTPEVMLGISKKLMVHVGGTLSNMHTQQFKGESIFLYGQYRFLSVDDVHTHFRMAAFVTASKSFVPFHNEEVSLMGDKTGIEAGLIATQLWHKFALSGTVSHTQLLDDSRYNKVIYVPSRLYKAISYSLSAGYLLFPREYTSYKQLNVNLYAELLAQQTLDRKTNYFDLAPAVQFIINSNSKINIGYRFQIAGNMDRMTQNHLLVSFERAFLNALKKKSS
jgi:hypothetical protein